MIRDPRVRGAVLQIAVVLLVLGLVAFFAHNIATNLSDRGIATGFGFLFDRTQWDISDRIIPHTAQSSYLVTFAVGITNTLYVSLLALVLVTVLGTLLGIARTSRNWLASRLAGGYVEFFRNTPLLLQILFWNTLLRTMPHPKSAEPILGGVYVTNRGLYLPAPMESTVLIYVACGLTAAIVASIVLARYLRRRNAGSTGRARAVLPIASLLMGLPLLAWLAAGAPMEIVMPKAEGFGISGGWRLTPEFLAVLAGLVAYYTAFVGEVVRGGIEGVDYGQWEAAQSLGLSNGSILYYVVLPQALRIIIPPLANQYMALVRNSSLAVAVGFPELFTIGTISINQMGQAIEVIVIIMVVYLVISFIIAAVMNFMNRRAMLVGRNAS